MSVEYLDNLILLSIQKKNLLEKFLDKTVLQKKIIEDEKTRDLERLLLEKDEIILEVDRIDRQYLEIYSKLKNSEGIESISEMDVNKYRNLKELRDITVELSDFLSKIDLLDRENTKLIKDKFGDVKSELKSVKTVQTAYKGYNNQVNTSVLIDERK